MMLTALRRRHAAVGENTDRGMLAVVMVVTVIGVGLAALMTPLVLTQSSSTGHTDSRVQALQTAETGLNAALGLIRSATSDSGTTGLSSALPCFSTSSPLAGAQTPTSTSRYTVSLNYYASDPMVPSVLTGLLPAALKCTVGAGLTDASNLAVLPNFARITAVGKAGSGSTAAVRSLSTTYSFNTGDIYNSTGVSTVVPGGQIRFNPRGLTNPLLCLDGGAATPVLNLATCGPVTMTQQQFVYGSDLTLRLVGPVTAAAPYGLCVSSVAPNTGVTLARCPVPGQATYDEQWSLNADSAFTQVRPDKSTWCLYVAPTGSNVSVSAKPCATGYDSTASWLPTPYAGTGAAGAGSNQLVNLSQFSRCVQDTGSVDPLAAANALTILYPCEQSTSPTGIDGYQQWAFDPTTGHWITSKANDAGSYCLTSPGLTGGSVTLSTCTASLSQKWTDNGAAAADQGNASQFLPPIRYTVVDSLGRCLTLDTATYSLTAPAKTPPNTSPYNQQFSKLTVGLCDGTAQQKWNANPNSNSSVLRNTTEN